MALNIEDMKRIADWRRQQDLHSFNEMLALDPRWRGYSRPVQRHVPFPPFQLFERPAAAFPPHSFPSVPPASPPHNSHRPTKRRRRKSTSKRKPKTKSKKKTSRRSQKSRKSCHKRLSRARKLYRDIYHYTTAGVRVPIPILLEKLHRVIY